MKDSQKPRAKFLSLLTAFFLFNFALLPSSILVAQSAPARMYLSPASAEINEGEVFTLQLFENSGEQPVNVVKANLTYAPELLEFSGTDDSDSGFNIGVKASGGNGSIEIIRGAVPHVYGEQLVIKINFKAKVASGSASVNIAEGSQLISPGSPPKNILSHSSGGTYTIKQPTPPTPAPVSAPTQETTPPPAPPRPRQEPAPVLTQVTKNEDKLSLSVATPSTERRQNQNPLGFWAPMTILVLTLLASIVAGSKNRQIKKVRVYLFNLWRGSSARLNAVRLNLKNRFS